LNFLSLLSQINLQLNLRKPPQNFCQLLTEQGYPAELKNPKSGGRRMVDRGVKVLTVK